MEKQLSIVIPIYKVEAYINKCLDSCIIDDTALMNQLEVIIVNDGTPDRSAELSREYVKRYPGTFRQIDKENGGHGSAWNVGLKEAKGKYLRFLDSDDWLTNLDKLMKKLLVTDVDIVFTKHKRWYSLRKEEVVYNNPIEECDGRFLSSNMWGCSGYGYECVNFWNATYKTAILKPLAPLFAEGVMYDDFILTMSALIYGRTCAAYNFIVYNYLIGREGQSMSLTARRKRAESYNKCLCQYEEVLGRVDKTAIPSDLYKTIELSTKGYAHFVFPQLLGYDYKTAKLLMNYIWKKYPYSEGEITPVAKRYSIFPFAIFYFLEYCRYLFKN